MGIYWGHILEIDAVNLGRHVQIALHPGRGNDEVDLLAGQCFDFPQALLDFKQPRPAGDAPGFQGGRHGETDGLFRAAQVRHYKVGGEGIEAPLNTFDAGVKRFQIKPKSALSE